MNPSNLLEQRFDVLACPTCKGGLDWQAQDSLLRCAACQADYPIIDQIVHFIQPEQLSGYNRPLRPGCLLTASPGSTACFRASPLP